MKLDFSNSRMKSGRIGGMILLFIFCGTVLYSQEKDTITAPGNRKEQGIHPNASTGFVPLDSLREAAAARDSTLETSHKKGEEKKAPDPDEVKHSPQRALISSILLPGLGQAYNKKYWKIPIVYGALGGAGYLITYYNDGYRKAVKDYNEAFDNSSSDVDYYFRMLKIWRRYLEMSYIGLVAVDALQVIDAYVDANLFFWDVSPDLSIHMQPSIGPVWSPEGNPVSNYGFRCTINF